MDAFVKKYTSVPDGDLFLCESRGVAYQADMSYRVDVPYFEKCAGYAGTDIANKLNMGRTSFVNYFVGPQCPVLDIGVGSGEFIAWRGYSTWGFDVDEHAIAMLKKADRWSDKFAQFKAFTFWDVIEHVEDPNFYFQHMVPGSFAFFSVPIFRDLRAIRLSKHYRPGEHLYYWTRAGFIDWMASYRFDLVGFSTFETICGRDSISTFAFKRQGD